MLCETLLWLDDQHEVIQRRKRCITRSFTAHIDDAFLKTDDLSRRYDSSTLEHIGSSGSDRVDFCTPSGEYAPASVHFNARLNHVLDRRDSHRFARPGDVKRNRFDRFVLQQQTTQLILVDI